MLNELMELDKELFLLLNGFHTSWLDPIMLFITDKLVWIPLYIVLVYIVFRDLGRQAWIALACIALTILLADQATSTLMKPYFARLRPSHEPALEGVVHVVDNYKGGRYGFASSHAANTFGAATFLFLLLGKKRRWVGWLFLWAAVVVYSRIYLGVHYPGDIVVGSLVGMLAAALSFLLFNWMRKHWDTPRREQLP